MFFPIIYFDQPRIVKRVGRVGRIPCDGCGRLISIEVDFIALTAL
jgi:hypothetical protein